MVKLYKITYDHWSATIKIDHDKAKDSIKAMVEFWMGWESRLRMNNGDYTKVFLITLGEVLIKESIEYNVSGLIRLFENREGWTKMDGTQGIEICQADSWEFDEEFEVTEIN